jgi:hypothetical protein
VLARACTNVFAAGPYSCLCLMFLLHLRRPGHRKWYAVLGPSSNASSIDQGMSLNAHLIKLPATDAHGFQQNLKVCDQQSQQVQQQHPRPLQLAAKATRFGHVPGCFSNRLRREVVDWTELQLQLRALTTRGTAKLQLLAANCLPYVAVPDCRSVTCQV